MSAQPRSSSTTWISARCSERIASRYPHAVRYCETCDALYDDWLGCEGCGKPPGVARTRDTLDEVVEVVRR